MVDDVSGLLHVLSRRKSTDRLNCGSQRYRIECNSWRVCFSVCSSVEILWPTRVQRACPTEFAVGGQSKATTMTDEVDPSTAVPPLTEQQKRAEMLADEDPLLISQSLTYVTDDGSVLHSFQSAPYSAGKYSLPMALVASFRSFRNLSNMCRSHRIQDTVYLAGDHLYNIDDCSCTYRCSWDGCWSRRGQPPPSGLVLVQPCAICRCHSGWDATILDRKHRGGGAI